MLHPVIQPGTSERVVVCSLLIEVFLYVRNWRLALYCFQEGLAEAESVTRRTR